VKQKKGTVLTGILVSPQKPPWNVNQPGKNKKKKVSGELHGKWGAKNLTRKGKVVGENRKPGARLGEKSGKARAKCNC